MPGNAVPAESRLKEYPLTEVGRRLEALMRQMDEWGERYAADSEGLEISGKNREPS